MAEPERRPRRGRAAPARFGRMASDALADLLDQRTPFGRLALVHVLNTAGDALLTVSLAGSLFFSISPEAAKSRVILYLVLTMAPFAVVAPMLGPVIDRSRGARRAMVVMAAAGRAAVCLILAGELKSLLLFPEAFTMLVLSKVYLVTKGSLVPQFASTAPSLPDDSAAFPAVHDDELATANAHLGLLASLAGLAASVPAVLLLKLAGGPWVLRLDIVVYGAAALAGARLPMRRVARAAGKERRSRPEAGRGTTGTDAEVPLALSAMSVLKGIVGFLTFLLAFSLRRMHAATWWYGLVLGASVAGAVVGVLLVPRVRRALTEPQILALSLWLVSMFAVLAAVLGGILIQAVLAFVIGIAGASGKPAFDALVQRHVPAEAQGRAFARFETRLQLVWVVGGLVPVVASLPMTSGDVVIAAVAAVSALTYLTGRRALHQPRSA